jgi:aspartyl-tRNA(Asn)/glutamyl-tRNA(Gln) amidotransferase subunit B
MQEGVSVSEAKPNSNVCPVCAGHPGSLPVINRKVVEFAVRAGLATNCKINEKSVFARKNYFYPDLPKGYQISQYDLPICEHGFLTIETEGGERKKITIERIHMEEDAGKNLHFSGYSSVNLNRAGVPLVEIVSRPELRSAQEAGAYLRALHSVVTYLGICDGNMQEGNFRCDANVSVMPKGSKVFGTRAEIKNVNSFRFVEKAIEYEIARQTQLIRSGGKVVQETRLYDSDKDLTASMRSKEEAHDYRYFPDPDLLPIRVTPDWVEGIRKNLPELPEQKRARYVSSWNLPAVDAAVLTSSKAMAAFFEEAVGLLGDDPAKAKAASNLVTGECARLVNEGGWGKLKALHVADAVKLTQAQTISSTGAKRVLAVAWNSGEEVSAIVDREGLKQVSDLSSLDPAIDKVIAANPGQVAEFRAGKEKLIGFFVGQVMKETGGKANPALLQEMIRKKLTS